MIDVDKLLELEAKATSSPWDVESFYSHGYKISVFNCFATIDGTRWKVPDFNCDDALLCKEMRNSIRQLCLEVKALRKVAEEARKLEPPSDNLISGWDLTELFEAVKQVGEARRGDAKV
jgi:hypothetical protein